MNKIDAEIGPLKIEYCFSKLTFVFDQPFTKNWHEISVYKNSFLKSHWMTLNLRYFFILGTYIFVTKQR